MLCAEEKVSRRLTLCIFPNICVCLLTCPRKTQRFTEGKSSVVILTNLCFHGLKMFSQSTPVILLFQHGKNLACCSFPPERETQMLARALNILASTANRFHLLLTASKLTSDSGKTEKGTEEQKHRGECHCYFFFPLRSTKHAYNYVTHNFYSIILAVNPRKLSSCLLFHHSIEYQAGIMV